MAGISNSLVPLIRADRCYEGADQTEALKALWLGKELPSTNTSIDFIRVPQIFTFYFEYKEYFDMVSDSLTKNSKNKNEAPEEFIIRNQMIYVLPEKFNM